MRYFRTDAQQFECIPPLSFHISHSAILASFKHSFNTTIEFFFFFSDSHYHSYIVIGYVKEHLFSPRQTFSETIKFLCLHHIKGTNVCPLAIKEKKKNTKMVEFDSDLRSRRLTELKRKCESL